MKQFTVYLLLIIFINSAMATPTKPTYPQALNLDSYKSLSLKLRSKQDEEVVHMIELLSNNNKRADLTSPSSTVSFRAFNGSNYTILSKPNLKECHHVEDIDSYMTIYNNLKSAWKKKEKGDLQFIGNEQVDDINCHVWRFSEENTDFQFYTTVPSKQPNNEVKLMRIIKDRNHRDKQIHFVYDNIDFKFNFKITDDNFLVDEDVKCE